PTSFRTPAPDVLQRACHENRMAGCGLMHLAHTADTRADVIFIDNGAPEVLVGSQGRQDRGEADAATSERSGRTHLWVPEALPSNAANSDLISEISFARASL